MLDRVFTQIKFRFFDFSGKKRINQKQPSDYIQSALEWFKMSLLPEGGSAAKYNMMTHHFTQGYPTSTANWIPVLSRIYQYYPDVYKSVLGDQEINRDLVSWVLRTQRRDGTFPSGYGDFMNQPPKVFNNGLIMNGLLDYYNAMGGQDLIEACINSAEWLLKVQSPDGSWRQFTQHQLSSNTLTASSLLRLASITGEQKYKEAAEKNLQFALALQDNNYYFKGNGIDSGSSSFTINIAYAIAGILEAGILTGNQQWKDAALNGLIPVLNMVNQNGFLVGEIDEQFHSDSSFSCLPGNSLLAILSYKLASLTGNADLRAKGNLLTDHVKRHQMVSKIPQVSGGISGSWPISGNYCSYEITSWGVRYFIEAVMMQDALR